MALRGRSKYLMFWSPKERKTGREGEKRKGEEGRRRRGRGGEPRSSKAKLQKGMELLTLSRDPWFCLVNGYLWYPNLGFLRISS